MHVGHRLIVALGIGWGVCWTPSFAAEEVKGLLDRLMAAPTIEAEAGFNAEMFIPPGEFYDPLWPHPQGDAVWLNDDGGEEGEKGSRIV